MIEQVLLVVLSVGVAEDRWTVYGLTSCSVRYTATAAVVFFSPPSQLHRELRQNKNWITINQQNNERAVLSAASHTGILISNQDHVRAYQTANLFFLALL